MDFSVIKEIGSAFLVGATVLLIIEGYLFFSAGWSITDFFRPPYGIGHPAIPAGSVADTGKNGSKEGVRLGAFVGIATMLGLLCQSAFQPLIDNADYPIHSVPAGISRLICDPDGEGFGCIPLTSSKNSLRLSVLLDRRAPLGASSLLTETLAQGLPARFCPEVDRKTPLSAWVTDLSADVPASPLRGCLLHIYYLAKNWAFTQPTLYDELSHIQSRIDFARSFSLVTISLLPWAFIFFFGSVAGRYLGQSQWWRRDHAAAATTAVPRTWKDLRPTRFSMAGWAVVPTLLLGALCMWTFDRLILYEGHSPWLASVWFAIGAAAAVFLIITILKHDLIQGWPRLAYSVSQMVLLVTILLIGHVLSFYAYAWDAQEFGKRAFGDFLTHDLLDGKPVDSRPSNGLLWFSESAEKVAAYTEIYKAAGRSVIALSKGLSAGSWAVVLDVDETILDNSEFQSRLIAAGKPFNEDSWSLWVQKEAAVAMPGAKPFIDMVLDERKGRVILVTNRPQKQCAWTAENLRRVAIRYTRLVCDRTGDGDKTARFEDILRGTAGVAPDNVLVWIGDDMGDFPHLGQIAHGDPNEFGTRLFVLPNPVYGSWQKLHDAGQ